MDSSKSNSKAKPVKLLYMSLTAWLALSGLPTAPALATLPPVLDGLSSASDDRDNKKQADPENNIFFVASTKDEKLQAQGEIYFLSDKINHFRERLPSLPGLDLSSLSEENRKIFEQNLQALQAIQAHQLARLLNRRGTFHAILGDQLKALSDLDEAVQFDDSYAPAYNNRAWLRAQKGSLSDALADVNKALELSPKMAEAYDTRGSINLALKNLEAAIKDFDASIECNPKYAEAYFHRALAYKSMGNQEKYQSDKSKARELDYPIESKDN
ncbi:MAG: tetratricopeptide repeat protein [Candidatus Obscuribacterales bacterium]|nr:tetratricopeptide repeat protein [Candidatus Obscuribacterales bacterium]